MDNIVPAIKILYEDNHLLIVNKPAGIPVQPGKDGDEALEFLAKKYLKEKYQKPGNVFLGVSHRIDRPVSGIVILAKTSKALARINEMFKNRTVEKTYWAVVENPPPDAEGYLLHWLKKDEKINKSRAYDKELPGSLRSELHYKLISKSEHYYLLEVCPATGRHHQIRVQLSAIGCPIKGDIKYGARRTNPNGNIHLHARAVSFLHPVRKQKVTITAPVPDDPLWQYFEKTSPAAETIS